MRDIVAIYIRNVIYWDVTPCSSVDSSQGFVALVGTVNVTFACHSLPIQ